MSEFGMTPHERERNGDSCISVLRLPAVIGRTGLRRSTIYSKMKEGTFPKAIKLGLRSVGWIAEEIEEWIQSRIDASRAGESE